MLEAVLESNTLKRLEALEGYHELIVRPFTPAQAKKWSSEIKRMERLIEAEPYPRKSDGTAATYALVMAFGLRRSAGAK